jgi:hypothetical protein
LRAPSVAERRIAFVAGEAWRFFVSSSQSWLLFGQLNNYIGSFIMPRGDKSKYTEKQKRKAEHIEEGYKEQGVSEEEAERRAWATVNKMDHGGKLPGGSGRGKKPDMSPAKKGGRLGGKAAVSRTKAERSASAKKAAQTRKRRAAKKK